MSEGKRGMSGWPALLGLRGAANETSTRESSTVSLRTKVAIPLAAAGTLAFVSVPATGTGAWICLNNLKNLMDWNLTGKDMAFGVFAMLIVGFIAWYVFGSLVGRSSPVVRNISVLALALIAIVVIIVLYLATDESDWLPGAMILVGLGLIFAGSLLTYNMVMVLRDPYGWQSPFEREFIDLYKRDLFGPEGEDEVRVSILEVRGEDGEYIGDTKVLGMDPETAVSFARELIRLDWNLTESKWGKTQWFYSHPKYRDTRNRMERNGYCRQLQDSTFEVTSRGRVFFRRLAEED